MSQSRKGVLPQKGGSADKRPMSVAETNSTRTNKAPFPKGAPSKPNDATPGLHPYHKDAQESGAGKQPHSTHAPTTGHEPFRAQSVPFKPLANPAVGPDEGTARAKRKDGDGDADDFAAMSAKRANGHADGCRCSMCRSETDQTDPRVAGERSKRGDQTGGIDPGEGEPRAKRAEDVTALIDDHDDATAEQDGLGHSSHMPG